MKVIQIKRPSARVLAKLRKGLKVRICRGEGMNLIIHPSRYNFITKTFAKDKGVQIALSPDELEANASSGEGLGIFGDRGDRAMKWLGEKTGIGGDRMKDAIYKAGDKIKPLVKRGIQAGLAAGATALGSAAPEIAPYLPAGVAGLSTLANSYLDDPSSWGVGERGNAPPSRGIPPALKQAGQQLYSQAHDMALQHINQQTGQQLGHLSSATISKALHDATSAQLEAAIMEHKKHPIETPDMIEEGQGLYGSGLYASNSVRGRGTRLLDQQFSLRDAGNFFTNELPHAFGGRLSQRREVSSVQGLGTIIGGYMPPALQSQPYSANFQFSHTLPPAYQRFSKGGGLY